MVKTLLSMKCACSQNGSYNSNIDTLGPCSVSWKMLQRELRTSCNDEPSSILYLHGNKQSACDTFYMLSFLS